MGGEGGDSMWLVLVTVRNSGSLDSVSNDSCDNGGEGDIYITLCVPWLSRVPCHASFVDATLATDAYFLGRRCQRARHVSLTHTYSTHTHVYVHTHTLTHTAFSNAALMHFNARTNTQNTSNLRINNL
mmetsp:Transcript_48621/g.71264  ORF Transcript_48621/g.71264 Transcript_48621/m.71264 type:complete len:128 (-) Transcript_48621:256-639(-)